MDLPGVLTFLALLVPGFTACAEFGSYAFVHPVIRRLPLEHHVAVEQGLVRTFGRFMPVAMPVSLVAVIAWASSEARLVPWLAVGAWGLGLVTTVIVNVGINVRTARTDAGTVEQQRWRDMRRRWEFFQGFRSWAFLASFALICLSVAFGW
ncbi:MULTISPECIES: anthrone oxygenase family protein [Prauserella salsuginis group]|uniref:DUF1772 domain-containing protein n=2 Tax=Prauserella salsuginis group TaxID=2893672 RepID=A0A839XJ97_9PSEU|nr:MULTISPECIES: DUF1772 domain-containing protein [Prauserella salsuginis group]MBB3662831.1 hypothetical protein [Prauserella sediminis]MCR3720527.1 protein of unknown function (DUF1772) [Prauserella flava]MCR3733763.1 protein of unknown function (DUF1772) [Prauserella salsuginis]